MSATFAANNDVVLQRAESEEYQTNNYKPKIELERIMADEYVKTILIWE